MTGGESVLLIVAAATRLELRPDQTASVGRAADCDIVLDDPLVSREHLIVRFGPVGWVVIDHDSRNGLWVDGRRVTDVAVGTDGREVRVGGVDGPAIHFTLSNDRYGPPWRQAGAGRDAGMASPPPPIRIGRASDNDIVLDDLLVSRHHAEFRQTGEGAEVIDLGSHNGTFVDGRRVSRERVGQGAVIGVGARAFRVTSHGLEPWAPAGAALVASELVVRVPGRQVLLDHVSLALDADAFLAVVGPSGSGKSTLLNALTGIRPADEGTLRYEGRDLYAEYDDLRRRIGIVPQDDVLHQQLTVRQALVYAAELRFPPEVTPRERLDRVDEVIGELGLTERADLAIRRLSGGQRKRTSVAMELLTKPSLLFLDEPTSGLDPGYERSMMELLRSLADGGRTVVIVTHAVNSLYLCDRVLVLAPGGRPAYFGPPADAPAFFGREDYQGVFQALAGDEAGQWPARFEASDARQRYLTGRLGTAVPTDADPAERSPPPRPRGGLRQFGTLTRRYARVLMSDRSNLVLLAAEAPIIGVLLLVISSPQSLAPPKLGELRLVSGAGVLLFNLVEAATWIGMSIAIRELVKERSIFRRERSVGLSIPAYLLSKVIVLAVIGLVQMVVLVAIATIHQGGPPYPLLFGWGVGELMVAMTATAIAAMSLGLLISALIGTENMAITLLPVVLIVSNVLALGGVSPDLLHKPILNQAQYTSGAQWGFSAAAATADLNQLQGLSQVVQRIGSVDLSSSQSLVPPGKVLRTQGERRFRHQRSVWLFDMGALLAMSLAAVVAAGLALGRLDPALVR